MRWRFPGGVALYAVLTLAAAAVVLPFVLRRPFVFYTDGGAVREAEEAARGTLRSILWERPAPVAGLAASGEGDVYEPQVSPDGDLLIFTRGRPGEDADLWAAARGGGRWLEPRPLDAVNSERDDMGACFSPDAGALIFYSDRPGGAGGYDLWMSRREGAGWSPPVNLGPRLNSPWHEISPALAPDGRTLYFASDRRPDEPAAPWDGSVREALHTVDYDIYACGVDIYAWVLRLEAPPAPAPDAAGQGDADRAAGLVEVDPVPVAALNTRGFSEGSLAVSPAGDFLYFASNRPGGPGGFDLYRSRLEAGSPGRPETLGGHVNSPLDELDPALGASGFQLYFSRGGDAATGSRGPASILVASAREVYRKRELGDTYWSFTAVLAFVGDIIARIHPAILSLVLSFLVCLVFFHLFRKRYTRLSLVARSFLIAFAVHILVVIWMDTNRVRRVFLRAFPTSETFEAILGSSGGLAVENVGHAIHDTLAETGGDAPPSLGSEASTGLGSAPREAPAPFREVAPRPVISEALAARVEEREMVRELARADPAAAPDLPPAVAFAAEAVRLEAPGPEAADPEVPAVEARPGAPPPAERQPDAEIAAARRGAALAAEAVPQSVARPEPAARPAGGLETVAPEREAPPPQGEEVRLALEEPPRPEVDPEPLPVAGRETGAPRERPAAEARLAVGGAAPRALEASPGARERFEPSPALAGAVGAAGSAAAARREIGGALPEPGAESPAASPGSAAGTLAREAMAVALPGTAAEPLAPPVEGRPAPPPREGPGDSGTAAALAAARSDVRLVEEAVEPLVAAGASAAAARQEAALQAAERGAVGGGGGGLEAGAPAREAPVSRGEEVRLSVAAPARAESEPPLSPAFVERGMEAPRPAAAGQSRDQPGLAVGGTAPRALEARPGAAERFGPSPALAGAVDAAGSAAAARREIGGALPEPGAESPATSLGSAAGSIAREAMAIALPGTATEPLAPAVGGRPEPPPQERPRDPGAAGALAAARSGVRLAEEAVEPLAAAGESAAARQVAALQAAERGAVGGKGGGLEAAAPAREAPVSRGEEVRVSVAAPSRPEAETGPLPPAFAGRGEAPRPAAAGQSRAQPGLAVGGTAPRALDVRGAAERLEPSPALATAVGAAGNAAAAQREIGGVPPGPGGEPLSAAPRPGAGARSLEVVAVTLPGRTTELPLPPAVGERAAASPAPPAPGDEAAGPAATAGALAPARSGVRLAEEPARPLSPAAPGPGQMLAGRMPGTGAGLAAGGAPAALELGVPRPLRANVEVAPGAPRRGALEPEPAVVAASTAEPAAAAPRQEHAGAAALAVSGARPRLETGGLETLPATGAALAPAPAPEAGRRGAAGKLASSGQVAPPRETPVARPLAAGAIALALPSAGSAGPPPGDIAASGAAPLAAAVAPPAAPAGGLGPSQLQPGAAPRAAVALLDETRPVAVARLGAGGSWTPAIRGPLPGGAVAPPAGLPAVPFRPPPERVEVAVNVPAAAGAGPEPASGTVRDRQPAPEAAPREMKLAVAGSVSAASLPAAGSEPAAGAALERGLGAGGSRAAAIASPVQIAAPAVEAPARLAAADRRAPEPLAPAALAARPEPAVTPGLAGAKAGTRTPSRARPRRAGAPAAAVALLPTRSAPRETEPLSPDAAGARDSLAALAASRARMQAGDEVLPELPKSVRPIVFGQAPPRASAAVSASQAETASRFVPRLYQFRERSARQTALRAGGGSALTEAAVDRGLEWLALHQSPDGRWSLRDYARHLRRPDRRDLYHPDWDGEGTFDSRGGGGKAQEGDTAATGLALLCFLGRGETHVDPGPYREVIAGGLDWLLSAEEADGDLRGGGNLYMHAIASFALCEAYAFTRDPRLRAPAQRAIDFTARSQNPRRGGWRYIPFPQSEDVDTSVFGWMLMAIKSARLGGLDVDAECLERAGRYLLSARMTSAGGRYSYQPGGSRTSPAMTAQGFFSQQVLAEVLVSKLGVGEKQIRRASDESIRFLLDNLPVAADQEGVNFYYWYYGTLALFQEGGQAWKTWNAKLSRLLVLLQVSEEHGSAKGSWDPRDHRAAFGGRLYSTTMSILCLEAYYRYAPLREAGGAGEKQK